MDQATSTELAPCVQPQLSDRLVIKHIFRRILYSDYVRLQLGIRTLFLHKFLQNDKQSRQSTVITSLRGSSLIFDSIMALICIPVPSFPSIEGDGENISGVFMVGGGVERSPFYKSLFCSTATFRSSFSACPFDFFLRLTSTKTI